MRGIFYFAKFNLEALLSLCEQLGGRKCTCDDVTKMPKSGSLNWVIFVTFEDGIEWVFRCPMAVRNQFYSEETSSKIVDSEAATLMYLKAHTSILVPEVYSYRQVRRLVSVLKEARINSLPIQWNQRQQHRCAVYSSEQSCRPFIGILRLVPRSKSIHRHAKSPQILPMSEKGREKVMEQLGSIMAELSDHRFTEIGSLFIDGGGDYTVGECLSPMLTWQERDSLDLDRGPFRQEHDYLVSLISAFTSHAQELPLLPHMFCAPVPDDLHYKSTDSARKASRRWNEFVAIGDKIRHSKNRHMYCMVGQMLAEMIPHLSSGVEGSFTLSHPDLHVGNIYVDDDLNITCIIDWSSTSTGPITELLTTPGLGGSARPPSVNLTAAFRTGFGQTCTKIGPELSQSNLWQVSDNMWPFSRLIRLLSKNDYEHFRRLFELVYKPSAEEAGLLLHLLHERAKIDENQKLLIEVQEYDMTAEELREEDPRHFSPARRANSDAVAVARKLTIMSEMNPGFLANHVLWQWVEEALKQDCPP